MRTLCLILGALCCVIFSFAQPRDYFQQEVHYRIEVALDDQLHQIRGTEQLTYTNHSPDTLTEIFFHLWPNAYQSRETAFAQQQVRHGSSKFYFAEDKDLGGFLDIDFQANGASLAWMFFLGQPDVALVQLDQPLLPGQSATLDIPFLLQIPHSFSRLGHVQESYQMTQWYPKPAVYDADGWHPMPYLDQGEYYSEFGSFDVQITLPANYLVAATGELQEASEKAFLEEQEAKSRAYLESSVSERIPFWQAFRADSIPPSSSTMKTISFQAEKVHDFAWFADKRFRVLSRSIELPSGRVIPGYIFFTFMEEWYWKDALDYLERSTQFYSERVGEYPWPQVTAVQSALSAGGGMEYPMITIIGLSGNAQALDEVITHEVGHNWFYGILGSNERDHPWMDEGLNSYYDHRYTEAYYKIPKGDYYLPKFIVKDSDLPFYNLSYMYFTRSGRELPPDTHSDDFYPGGYYMGAYDKPALAFRHLEGYWGRAKLDAAMQQYYEEWAFRHPGPEDLRESLERFGGEDLGWLFDGYINSTETVDYTIQRVRREGDSLRVFVRNNGRISAPLALGEQQGGQTSRISWHEGFSGSSWLTLPNTGVEALVIDPEGKTPDLYPNNNRRRLSNRLGGIRDYRLQFLTGVDHSTRKQAYWMPLVGWNDYDKWMVGLGIHNYSVIERKVEFAFLPAYSFVSNSLNGLANLQFNVPLRSSGALRRFRLGSTRRQFSSNYNFADDFHLRYARNSFYGVLDFALPEGKSGFRSLSIKADQTQVERPDYPEGVYVGNLTDEAWFLRLGWSEERYQAINPWSWSGTLEYKARSNHRLGYEPYLKMELEGNYAFSYQRFRNLDFRLFASGFIWNDYRSRNLMFPWSIDLTAQGAGDYLYEGYYLGRSDQNGFWNRQRSAGEGGFYSALPPTYRRQSGATNHFLVALNFSADLPRPLPRNFPLRPFVNLAYAGDIRGISSGNDFTDQLWWEAGLSLELLDGRVGIALPLVVSENLRTLFDQNGQSNVFNRLSFTFDLHRLDPLRMREDIGM
jgi:hypothetical protein